MTKQISGTSITLPAEWLTNEDVSPNATIARSKLEQNVLEEFPVPFTSMRVWDALATLPVTTAATDDLALATGTFGTDYPKILTGELEAAGSTTRKIGFEIPVPPEYDDGQTVQIRVRAGMLTTPADVAATVDLEVYAADLDGGVGSDLYTGAAQDANSLTLANLDFALTASSVDPGSRLLCVLSFLVNDAATGTVVQGVVTDVRLMADCKG